MGARPGQLVCAGSVRAGSELFSPCQTERWRDGRRGDGETGRTDLSGIPLTCPSTLTPPFRAAPGTDVS